jgi:agmatine deiminase
MPTRTSASASATDAPPPGADGFRWPAEWERHAATWLAWPHNADTWPGRLDRAQAGFAAIVQALAGRERVCVLVGDDAMEEAAHRRLAAVGLAAGDAVDFHRVPTDDAWLRDSGPIVLVRDAGGRRERLAVDFRFDAWGGKYPPWDRDAAVPGAVARLAGLPVREAGFVLEGGSVDGNGRGAVLTTESCLLHPNREAGRTREAMERRLADWLGARQVLWLAGGIAGDDTDGHIDDVARFADAGTVVAAVADASDAENHGPLAENRRRLASLADQDGRPLTVVELPMPPRQDADGQRCPASYANFYLANGVALVPTFGVPSDARALAILRELWSDREVLGVPSADLVVGLGAIHCLTQQEPAARADG